MLSTLGRGGGGLPSPASRRCCPRRKAGGSSLTGVTAWTRGPRILSTEPLAPLTKVLFFRQLDILCNEEILGKDHTLKFVVVTRWRFKVRLCCDCVWFIPELRSNSPPWDCQQCGCSGVISPRVAMGCAVPRPPLVSSLLVRVTDVLGREGPLQPEGTLPATLPLWSRKQTGVTPRVCLRAGETQAGRRWPGPGQAGAPSAADPRGVPAPPSLSCRRRPSCCTTDPRWTCCEHSGDSAPRRPRACARRGHSTGVLPWASCGPDLEQSIYHFCMRENWHATRRSAQGYRRGAGTSVRTARRRPSFQHATFACFPGLENLSHFRSVYGLGFTIAPKYLYVY